MVVTLFLAGRREQTPPRFAITIESVAASSPDLLVQFSTRNDGHKTAAQMLRGSTTRGRRGLAGNELGHLRLFAWRVGATGRRPAPARSASGRRQFSGRIVTVTNDKIFDEPVFNFTQEFRFIWEELHIPVPYRADRARAERILLDAVYEATRDRQSDSDAARRRIEKKYGVTLDAHDPRVYWTLTDNWLEMSVRFVVPDHGIREIKDQISRTILREFDAAGLEIASATVDISSVPTLRLEPAEGVNPWPNGQ